MPTITVTRREECDVRYLKVSAGVRYWEDATVDGEIDGDGSRIPCRNGDAWEPLIELETGIIIHWREGVTADIHYKVCDAGIYELLDAAGCEVVSKDGYVPDILSPAGNGYGDYIIMSVDGLGRIAGWRVVLDDFEESAHA